MYYHVSMRFTRRSRWLQVPFDSAESAAAAIADAHGWPGFCLGEWTKDPSGVDSCAVYASESDRNDDATAGACAPRIRVGSPAVAERQLRAVHDAVAAAAKPKTLTGVEKLRRMLNVFSTCNETFNTRWSVEQLESLYDAYMNCGWDITPDRWSEQQLRDVFAGVVPVFGDD